MYYDEEKLDQETLDSAYSQINYFSFIPKHIKFIASDLKSKKEEHVSPSQMFQENITVRAGKLNIPFLTQVNDPSLKEDLVFAY